MIIVLDINDNNDVNEDNDGHIITTKSLNNNFKIIRIKRTLHTG